MPVRSGRLPVSGLEYAELCREAESSQSLVSRVLRVTVSLAHTVTHSLLGSVGLFRREEF